MIQKAIHFATLAHAGQKRKGTDVPYILHPLEAGIIVSQIRFDEDIICGAILHDVVEDAGLSVQAIEKQFNNRIAKLVQFQTKDIEKSWQEQRNETIEKISSEQDLDKIIVALGDKLSNIRAIHQDYQTEGEELWKRFRAKEKDKVGWYYSGLVEAFYRLSGYSAYQEFKTLTAEVFS